MSTTNNDDNQNNDQIRNKAFGFIALASFLLLFVAAFVIPIYVDGLHPVTISTSFGFVLGVLAIFFAFLQVFPKVIPKLTVPRIPRSTAILTLLLIPSLTMNTFFITSKLTLTSTPSPSSTPSTFAGTSTSTQIVTVTPSSVIASSLLPPGIAVHGTPAISDPMINDSRGYQWDPSIDTGSGNPGAGSCEFEGNGFHIKADNNYRECVENKNDLTNFVLEATMMPTPGSSGGFILRRDTNSGVGYLVDFGPSGHYSIKRDPNNVVLRDTYSPLIQPNHPSYLVVIEVLRNQITLYIDDIKIDSIIDNTYNHGHIGLYVAGDNGTPKTEVTFKNITVWSL